MEEDRVMPDNTSSHNPTHRYPPERKERAVRLVFESIEQSGQRTGAIPRVANHVGIGIESLRQWVAQAEIDRGNRPS